MTRSLSEVRDPCLSRSLFSHSDVIDLFIFSCLAWLHFNKYGLFHKDIIGRNSFTQKRKKCVSQSDTKKKNPSRIIFNFILLSADALQVSLRGAVISPAQPPGFFFHRHSFYSVFMLTCRMKAEVCVFRVITLWSRLTGRLKPGSSDILFLLI